MSSKVRTRLCMSAFFFLFLFFFLSITRAGRPGPSSSIAIPSKTQHKVHLEAEKVKEEESCDGVGEEECLMRRTLAAHLDYIYTQKHKP